MLVCVDHFTSWYEAAPLKTITANEVIEVYSKLIILRHGCSENILSDQGKQLISNVFQGLCDLFNIDNYRLVHIINKPMGKLRNFTSFLPILWLLY